MDDLKNAAKARVAEVDGLPRFQDRIGVWLSYAGAAYYQLYREALAPIGVKPAWVTALAIIEREPGITQSSLGRRLAINRASAMAMATEMEAGGLIERSSPAGRNRIVLQATSEGLARLEEACAIEETLTRSLCGDIDQHQRDTLLTALKHVLGNTARNKGDDHAPP